MKRYVVVLLALALVSTPSNGDHHEELGWLDLQKCSMCKLMGANMDMMAHVTWENHKIDNGALSASVIPKEYQDRMQQLHQKMKMVEEKLDAGEKMPLCGHCASYGKLKMAGAKTQEIETDFGMIALFTSNDPEVVKQIHAHTDKTNAEFKKFLEAQMQNDKKPE
ncbi:hypothetical protein Mal15_42020 [Stieleria maiorica]|uniref:Uncharacterized protein n=1 Tax=Stieleria maiorica TaxID=2795974 RepID=A0A5B9MFU3_9BACT|nr:hypothetical protein [Stieleria maiorica]QEG00133.1 hypothetical protein Mal15_42020 [Stieleria maiorica]